MLYSLQQIFYCKYKKFVAGEHFTDTLCSNFLRLSRYVNDHFLIMLIENRFWLV